MSDKLTSMINNSISATKTMINQIDTGGSGGGTDVDLQPIYDELARLTELIELNTSNMLIMDVKVDNNTTQINNINIQITNILTDIILLFDIVDIHTDDIHYLKLKVNAIELSVDNLQLQVDKNKDDILELQNRKHIYPKIMSLYTHNQLNSFTNDNLTDWHIDTIRR